MNSISAVKAALLEQATEACVADARANGLQAAREQSRRLSRSAVTFRDRLFASQYATTLAAITLPNAA